MPTLQSPRDNDANQIADDSLTLALKVSDRVEITDVRLLRSECRQGEHLEEGPLRVRLSHKAEWRVANESNSIQVKSTHRFQATPESKGSVDSVVVVEATFALTYKVSSFDGLNDDNYQMFAETNGVFNAWPYWREYLQGTIARMGLPRLTIPVFRLGPKADPAEDPE